jgi:hypothetical protein
MTGISEMPVTSAVDAGRKKAGFHSDRSIALIALTEVYPHPLFLATIGPLGVHPRF